jgi:hypothetical protein
LKDKVDFSHRTANNFMKVATEFQDSQSLAKLGQTKVFAILDIPNEEREQFITTQHEVNGQTKTVG